MRILAAALALLAFPAVAIAHHGWSSYDPNAVLKITAPIETAAYRFPHGLITLTHEGAVWQIVLAPPSRMTARGLSADDLAVGAVVTVEGYPSRKTEHELRAERITIDGTTTELRCASWNMARRQRDMPRALRPSPRRLSIRRWGRRCVTRCSSIR